VPYCDLLFYDSLEDLGRHAALIAGADVVMVGSYVPDGVAVGRFVQATARGVRAFYDIDTPVTLAKLRRGDFEYLAPDLIPNYDLYFSFTGGPTLDLLEHRYGSPAARALYCSVDPARYLPIDLPVRYDLGYLGTYSDDRQPTLERLLLEPARRLPNLAFVVAGPQYPESIEWPDNVTRLDHVPPEDHSAFYGSCRWTLNVTRSDMIAAGWSPSVRLFEAAACGTPILSDRWAGLDTLLEPDREIRLVDEADAAVAVLSEVSDADRRRIADRARQRILAEHTAAHRAAQFEADCASARARLVSRPTQPSAA
jgi:spore maturation protein CgeB